MPANPKHPSVRARKNRTSTATELLVVDPADVEVPELPERIVRDRKTGEVSVGEWNSAAAQTWVEVWSSPMAVAGEFIEADFGGLRMLLALEHDFWTRIEEGRGVTELAAEIARIRKTYGLAPMGRRSLQWTIAQTAESVGRTRQRAQRSSIPGTATEVPVLEASAEDVTALLDALE